MSDLEILKSKFDKDINFDKLEERLSQELNIEGEELYLLMLDVVILILDYTNSKIIPYSLQTTFINMVKDYYYLNVYDKSNSDDADSESKSNVKSITEGDTTVTFGNNQSQIKINGVMYNTGTVEPDDDLLIQKYASELNRHRKLRW